MISIKKLKWWGWLPVFITLSIFVLAALNPVSVEERVLAPQEKENQYFFGDNRAVGHEFAPQSGLAKVRIPVGVKEGVEGPLLLHIREDFFGPDIRQATQFEIEEGHNVVDFKFRRILNPPEKLVWVLEAPHSPGRSHWVYREKDENAYTAGNALYHNVTVVGNFSFDLVYKQIAIKSVPLSYFAGYQYWELYAIVIGLVGAIVSALLIKRMNIHQHHKLILLLLILISFGVHVWFSARLPVINDEGSYVQDVQQSTLNFWPLRDFLTKGPIFLLVLKAWVSVVPHSYVAWRLLSAVAWAFVIFLSYLLAKKLKFSETQRLLAASLLALLPAANVLTSTVLLQPVSVALGLAALLLFIQAKEKQTFKAFVLSSLVFVLAYLARASTITLLPVFFVLFLLNSENKKKDFIAWTSGLLAIFTMAVLLSAGLIGWQKTAVFFNAEALLISNERVASGEIESEPVIRQITQNFTVLWQGGSVLLLGIIAFLVALISRKRFWIPLLGGLPLFAIIYITYFHLSDMAFLLPSRLPVSRIFQLAIVFVLPAVFFLNNFLQKTEKRSVKIKKNLLVVFVWLASLMILYLRWGNFRQSYVIEFLVPLSLLAAWAVTAVHHSWSLKGAAWSRVSFAAWVFLLIAAGAQGYRILAEWPLTGSMSLTGIKEVSQVLQDHVPQDQEIFTAQSAVTALSGHRIINGYAHPGWYLYEKEEAFPQSLREIYFIDPELLTEDLKTAAAVLLERRTQQVYFAKYPDRQKILAEQFELVAEIDSGASDPYLVYLRGE